MHQNITNCPVLNWTELNWTELNWSELNSRTWRETRPPWTKISTNFMSLYSINWVVKIPTILAKNNACFLNVNRLIKTFRYEYNTHILDEWKSCAASCNTPQLCHNICNWCKVGRQHRIYLKAAAITYNLENNRPHYVNLGRRRIETETTCNIICQWMLTCNYSPRVKQSTQHRECDHSQESQNKYPVQIVTFSV
jgi:hypothetical protein